MRWRRSFTAVPALLLALTACSGTTRPASTVDSYPAPGPSATAGPSGEAASTPSPPALGPTLRATPSPSVVARSTGAAPGSDGPIASEDFNGTHLDLSRWRVYNALATNGVSRWTPDMVRVANGELQIIGTGRDPSGRGNVSGGLCWCVGNAGRTYGRWEVRARFDAGTGFGQAILLWPVSERWPEDGEIDIVETPGGAKDTAEATVHWGTSADHREDNGSLAGDYTGWHVYTVDWRPTSVRVFVDGRVLYDSTRGDGPPVIPHTPMNLALQQEPGPFGSNWVPAPTSGTPAQVVMHIDWIRLYS